MENLWINMVYIIVLFMALIPYGESLNCSCSPSAATGSAINGANSSYYNITFIYYSDGGFSYLTYYGFNDNAVPVDLASYPDFRIDFALTGDYSSVVDPDDPSAVYKNYYYYAFCYRSGGYSLYGGYFFDAGTDAGADCSSKFPNAEVSACCSCCCGSNSDDFITTPDANTALSVTDPATCPSRQTTTTPGGRGGD